MVSKLQFEHVLLTITREKQGGGGGSDLFMCGEAHDGKLT